MKNIQKSIFDFKLWLILFIASNFIFAFYHITFFWGNHDWDWVKGTTQVLQLNTGMFEGRYAKFILNVGLFDGQVLPILNNLVAFALLSLGAVWLTSYWQIKNFTARLLVALMPLCAPYILGWLYFPINILGNFSAVALVSYGLIATKREQWQFKIISIVCFLLALGVYPSTIEMMFVCWCVHSVLEPKIKPKVIIKSFSLILVSLIIFKTMIYLLGKLNIVYSGHYNMQMPTVLELVRRIPETIELAFSQLIITLPFFSLNYKIMAATLFILAIVCTFKKWFWWSMALAATVLSSFFTIAPEETMYMPRINFYGINFLIAGAVAVLLAQQHLYRNLGVALSLFLIWGGIKANIEATKVWYLGQKAEIQLVERISNKIGQQSLDTILVPVIAGELPLRPRYYATPYQHKSPYILNGSLLVRHIPSGMFNFYATTPFLYNYSQIAELTPEIYQFLDEAQRSWPAPESLFIDEKYVIILLTDEGVAAIKSQLPY